MAIRPANAAARPAQIQQYLGKISGPLLDRIDIHVEVPAVPYKELRGELVGRIVRPKSASAWSGRARCNRRAAITIRACRRA